MNGIIAMGWTVPSKIQAEAIPIILSSNDRGVYLLSPTVFVDRHDWNL